MKFQFPDGVTVVAARPSSKPGFVLMDLDIDVAEMFEGIRRSLTSVGRAAQKAGKSFRQFAEVMRATANDEVRVSGLEARFYVRGGFYCPDINDLVQNLLRTPECLTDDDGEALLLRLLTTENRARLAAAALRGWAEHAPAPWRHPEVYYAPGLPWYRFLSAIQTKIWVDSDGRVSTAHV